MNKLEALENIKKIWNDSTVLLGDKIHLISKCYYEAGLDIPTTAAFIKSTPAEFESLIELSYLDDDVIVMLSKVAPPKTTWTMIASLNSDEIMSALEALKQNRTDKSNIKFNYTYSEFIYNKMIEISGPSIEQLVGNLTGIELKHAQTKGDEYKALTEKESKFLKSVAAQKRKGKTLSDKQLKWLIDILESLVSKNVIVRNSIDGDVEICNKILDALGK